MSKFFLVIILSVFCFSQSKPISEKEIYNHNKKYLPYYYERNALNIDSTKYTIKEKSSLIEKSHLSGDYNKLSSLYFFESDTAIAKPLIKKWIMALYMEQHYHIIQTSFSFYFPTNYHVVMSHYKSKRYKDFLENLKNLKVVNLSTHLAKLDALFKVKEYEKLSNDTLYFDREMVPLQIKQLHIRANYKLKNHQKIVNHFKTITSQEMTPEILFIGAQAYLRLKQYDVAHYFFNLYINNAKKNELAELQLAYYYQGLSYLEQNKITEADNYFNNAIDINPSYTDLKAFIHQTLGGYYQREKKYQKSLDEWINYLSLLPQNHSDRGATVERIEILREKAFLHGKQPAKSQ